MQMQPKDAINYLSAVLVEILYFWCLVVKKEQDKRQLPITTRGNRQYYREDAKIQLSGKFDQKNMSTFSYFLLVDCVAWIYLVQQLKKVMYQIPLQH